MWRGWLPVLCVLLLVSAVPGPVQAPHAGGGTTDVGIFGTLRDLAIDAPRGRLYVTDDPNFGGAEPPGLAVVDLGTHQEVARLNMSDVTGVALSPSGTRLAVGTYYGELRLIDPDTMQVISSGYFSDPPYAAYLWDMAFDGENRLVASLGIPYVSCDGSVIVLNLTAMSVEARLTDAPCGIGPFSGIRIDEAARRLYILGGGAAYVYDLGTSPPTRLFQRQDSRFTTSGALSIDGRRLYTADGAVYDTSNLTLLSTTLVSGDVALDEAAGFAYYFPREAMPPVVKQVALGDGSLRSQFRFRGGSGLYPQVVHAIALDSGHNVAYVLSSEAQNANSLHAVALEPGFLDPSPPDGSVVPYEVYVTTVNANEIDIGTVGMTVDGQSVSPQFDVPSGEWVYGPASPFREGAHRITVSGRDSAGAQHDLAWAFTVDTKPPEIYLDPPADGYHEAHVTVHGRIVDPSFRDASADGVPLTVDPSGAFQLTLDLREGSNRLRIFAEDQFGRGNETTFNLLYIPARSPVLAGLLAGTGAVAAGVVVALLLRDRRRKRGPPPEARPPPTGIK